MRWRSATLRDGTPVVVSGGHDGSFQVCHLDTGVALGPPVPVRPGPVSSLAVGRRRDGTPVVVTGGAGSVMVKGGVEACVWDLQSGAVLAGPLPGHRILQSVAIGVLRDGTPVLVSGGVDPELRVCDLGLRRSRQRPGGRPRRLSLCRGGRSAARRDPGRGRRGPGRTIWRWDLESGLAFEPLLRAHERGINSIAVGARADGTPVVVSGGDEGMVRIWDLETGAALGEPLRCQEGWDQVGAVAAGVLADRTSFVAARPRIAASTWWDWRPAAASPSRCAGTTRESRRWPIGGPQRRHPGSDQRRRGRHGADLGPGPSAPAGQSAARAGQRGPQARSVAAGPAATAPRCW